MLTLDPYAMDPVDTALEYARAPGATPSVVSAITTTFQAGLAALPSFAQEQTKAGVANQDYTYTTGTLVAGDLNSAASFVCANDK